MGQIRLKSGTMFDPLNPDPSLITIEDIAYGLAGQFRYAGHSRYTVAQHSVLGAEYLGRSSAALGFLLHDAEEGLGIPDLTRPVKQDPSFAFYIKAGRVVQEAVAKRFKINLNDPLIHFVDNAMLRTEQKVLFGRKVKEDEIVLPIQIDPWSPERAEKEFLQKYHLLTSPTTFTSGEYGKSLGLGRHAAMERLTKLEKRGIVERVRVKQNQGGIVRPNVQGWRFIGNTEVGSKGDRGSSRIPVDAEALVESYSTSDGGSGRETVVGSGGLGETGGCLSGEKVVKDVWF